MVHNDKQQERRTQVQQEGMGDRKCVDAVASLAAQAIHPQHKLSKASHAVQHRSRLSSSMHSYLCHQTVILLLAYVILDLKTCNL